MPRCDIFFGDLIQKQLSDLPRITQIAARNSATSQISGQSHSRRQRSQSPAGSRRVQRLMGSDRKAGVHLYPSTMVNAPALARPGVSDNAGTSRRMFVRVVQADFED